MAFIAVELHGCAFRPVYLYGPLDRFFIRLKMGDIQCCISQQLFPDFFAAVAEEALLRPWSQVFCPVSMAVQARQTFHSGSMHYFVLVASQAISFLEAELMGPVSVTFGALDLLHKDMFCVVPGAAYVWSIRKFIALFPVAGDTDFPGYDDFTVTG